MNTTPNQDKPTFATFLRKLAALFCAFGLLALSPAKADSVMALPGGGENIMVTFDEIGLSPPFPLAYRGVTYSVVEGIGASIWANPDMPITRTIKSPMLAIITDDEAPGGPANPISLRLDFDQPSAFFGFGLGFNNLTQIPDGSQLADIGSVTLEFSNSSSAIFPLSASRVLCCTETRFDYSDTDDGLVGNGLVESAVITLDYSYDPFAPGSGYPGELFALKFMGIDDVTYTTAASNSVVPVPSAVWLFGTGLIGLAGMARIKKA